MATEVVGPIQREHLSFSQLKTAATCGEKYRRKYIMGHPTDRNSVAAMAGGAFHHAVDQFEKRYVSTSYSPTWWDMKGAINELTVLTKQAINAEMEEHEILTEDLQYFGKQDLHYYQTTAIPRFSESYATQRRREAALGWQWFEGLPEFSELECVVRVFGGMSVIGAIDQIAVDSQGRVVIRDLKTGKPKGEHAVQMEVYRYLLAKHYGVEADYGQILYVNRTEPHPQVVEWHTKDADIQTMLYRMYQAFEHDTLMVTGPFNDHCSICDFRTDCKWGQIRVHGSS